MGPSDKITPRGDDIVRDPVEGQLPPRSMGVGVEIVAGALLESQAIHRPYSLIANPTREQIAASVLVCLHQKIVDVGRGSEGFIKNYIANKIVAIAAAESTLDIPGGSTLNQIESRERHKIDDMPSSQRGALPFQLSDDINVGRLKLMTIIEGKNEIGLTRDESLNRARTAQLFNLLTSDRSRLFSFDTALNAIQMGEHKAGLMALISHFAPTL